MDEWEYPRGDENELHPPVTIIHRKFPDRRLDLNVVTYAATEFTCDGLSARLISK